MANRNEYGPRRSPFKVFLYILVVVILLGGIGYLVKCTREKKAAFEDQIRTMDEKENGTADRYE